MRRISKNIGKRAFTLLEVLLAVAIGLIASTMILEGVVSTMQYSSNTVFFSKLAETHEASAYHQIALSHKDLGDGKYGNVDTTAVQGTLTFTTSTGITRSISVNEYAYGQLNSTSGSTSNINELSSTIGVENSSAIVSDNRYASVYIPVQCNNCLTHNYMRVAYSDEDGWLWFCCNVGGEHGCGATRALD